MALANVSMQVMGTKLVLTVDLAQTMGMSSSGKSEIIASTNGNVTLRPSKVDMEALANAGVRNPENIRIGLNVYRKIEGAATA